MNYVFSKNRSNTYPNTELNLIDPPYSSLIYRKVLVVACHSLNVDIDKNKKNTYPNAELNLIDPPYSSSIDRKVLVVACHSLNVDINKNKIIPTLMP